MLNKIYPEHRKLFVIFFVVAILFLGVTIFFDFLPQNLDSFVSSFASNVITFMSICFGFYFTSMSILFSSKYITHLNEVDEKKPDQRKIHTFRAYFQIVIYLASIAIIMAFVLLTLTGRNPVFVKIIFSLLCCLLALNLSFAFLILKVFLNALIVQARPK